MNLNPNTDGRVSCAKKCSEDENCVAFNYAYSGTKCHFKCCAQYSTRLGKTCGQAGPGYMYYTLLRRNATCWYGIFIKHTYISKMFYHYHITKVFVYNLYNIIHFRTNSRIKTMWGKEFGDLKHRSSLLLEDVSYNFQDLTARYEVKWFDTKNKEMLDLHYVIIPINWKWINYDY